MANLRCRRALAMAAAYLASPIRSLFQFMSALKNVHIGEQMRSPGRRSLIKRLALVRQDFLSKSQA